MELVVIATKKKLNKEPMRLMLNEMAKQSQIRRLTVIELDGLKSAKQLERAIEDIDLASSILIHKPHELFSSANKQLLQAYTEMENHFYYVQDKLESIKRIHSRLDMHTILSTLELEGMHTPCVYLLESQLTDEALLWADTHSPFLLKPNDSNNHNLYLVKSASSLSKLYPELQDEAERRKAQEVGEASTADVDLLHCNSIYLMEQYIPHSAVFKLYTYRGTIIHTDFRAPLRLPEAFHPEGLCEAYGACDTSEASYRKINSQTCLEIQTSIAYAPTPVEWRLVQSVAQLIYTSLGLSILGIDALFVLISYNRFHFILT